MIIGLRQQRANSKLKKKATVSYNNQWLNDQNTKWVKTKKVGAHMAQNSHGNKVKVSRYTRKHQTHDENN